MKKLVNYLFRLVFHQRDQFSRSPFGQVANLVVRGCTAYTFPYLHHRPNCPQDNSLPRVHSSAIQRWSCSKFLK